MTEAKHTPGPWRLRYGKLFEYDYLLKAGKDTPIAYWNNFKIRTKKESKANARLIAAAPELLQALRSIAAITTCADQDQDAMCAEIQGICRVALAKAIAKVTKGAA